MGRTKELAESQFDASAPPISLGVKFDHFCAFELNPRILDDDVDQLHDFDIFSDEIDDIPIDPPSLALIANDLDPVQRNIEYERIQQLSEDEEFLDLQNLFYQSEELESSTVEKVDSIDFKIKHSEIKKDLGELRPDNKVTTAFRLISVAIDKLSDEQKKKFDLKETKQDEIYYDGLALIDKSISSIKFINQLGIRIMNQFISQFPDRYKEFPKNDELIIDWLNKHNRTNNQLDFIFTCAYISSKIKFSNIEMNDYPALIMQLDGFWHFRCHQILRIMHLHTISINSNRFNNLKKFVQKFSLVYGGSRLHYLEYLISEAEKGYIFFETHEDNFSQLKSKWKSPIFIEPEDAIKLKLSRLNSEISFLESK